MSITLPSERPAVAPPRRHERKPGRRRIEIPEQPPFDLPVDEPTLTPDDGERLCGTEPAPGEPARREYREPAVPEQAAPQRSLISTDLTVSAIVPARNEEKNVGWVIERLRDVHEVVLVDGHSTDRTIDVAREVRPDIVVVPEDAPGKGAAMRTGLRVASGDVMVLLDADGSMDPREVAEFVRYIEQGFDFVKGSRFMSGGGTADMTFLRRLGNQALLEVANILHSTRHTDLCYGYMALHRRALDRLELTADGFEIETQIVVRAARAGLETKEIPSFELPRRSGESNLKTFPDGFRVLRTILEERFASHSAAAARS